MRTHRILVSRGTVIAVLLGAAVVLPGAAALTPSTVDQPARALQAAEELSDAFAFAAEAIEPSVVVVRSVREIEAPQLNLPPQLRPFFGPMGPGAAPEQGEGQQPHQIQQGQGSGFVVSEDGYILTNNHVIDGASEVTVVLSDDRTYAATVVGADPQTDVAVLRIKPDRYLTPVRFGDSSALRVGQWVVAAGSPLGLASSITAGIVSATGRTRLGLTNYDDFIQTDAAINHGNSGGPLVNLRGDVVGINTAIFSETGGNVGIGFAIPINLARHVMDELISQGRVIRGWLGVVIQDMNEGLARSFSYEGTTGALIADVTPGGPADQAGLRSGDIVLAVGGNVIRDIDQLKMLVADIDPGEKVTLDIHRDGTRATIGVTIGELPSRATAAARVESGGMNLGMTLQDLTPGLAARLGLDEGARGVIITVVQPLSDAARAGLFSGDVITHVQDAAVADIAGFQAQLRSYDLADGVRLTVRRGDASRFVFLQQRRR